MYRVDNSTGLLSYVHDCEVCSRHPREDDTEDCEMCGWTNDEINAKMKHVERMNEAYMEKYGKRGVFE